MSPFLESTAHAALLVSLMSSFAPAPAFAADQTVAQGVNDIVGKTLKDTDTLTIEKAGTLDVDDTAIILDGASPAPGVTVINSGAIKTRDRGIDTKGKTNPRYVTIINNAGASIETDADLFRVNTEVTEGTITVDNAGTMLAHGGQVLDFDAVESPDAVITIKNQASGKIVAEDSDAINLHGGAISITNSGLVSSVLSESRGIDIAEFANVSSLNIVNKEGATIEAFGEAIRIDSDGNEGANGVVMLDNAGLIVSHGVSDDPGQAVDFDKIESTDAKITINNRATGEIRGEADDAIRPGEGAAVNNWGKIISQAAPTPDGDPDDDMKSDGIDVGEHKATINNYAGGLISGARHGITTDTFATVYNETGAIIIGNDGSGFGSDGDGEVLNYGRITGTINETTPNDNGDGDGVDIDGFGKITNYGIIEGTGAKGIKDDSPNGSEGIAMGGGSIDNASAQAIISGKDNGILVDDSAGGDAPDATTITNKGTIRGDNGFGVKLIGTKADIVTNSGTIEGGDGLALDLGGGDDTLNLLTGSQFIGRVDGGAGSDTVTLDGTGTFEGGENFEFLTVKSGAWKLTGSQNYSGGIDMEGGTLNVSGAALGGLLTVGAGSVLDGNGTVGSVSVAGTVAPGNSIGKITVTGNYEQLAGSTYQVEINPQGQSDFIDVAGTATLAGSVKVMPMTGAYTANTRYTILTAGSGVTGKFDDPAGSMLFIDLALNYDTNNVYLDASRNDVSFADVAATKNQRRLAAGADSLGAGNAIYDTLTNLTDAASARTFYDALSGEIHSSVKTALIEDSHFIRDTATNRVRAAFDGVAAMPIQLMVYGEDTTKQAPVARERFAMWGQAFGGWGSTDGTDNTAALDHSTAGLLVGADTAVGENWRLGLLAGYSHSTFDVDDRHTSGESDNYHLGVYGGSQWGALGFRTGASYSWSNIDTRRSVVFPGLTDRLTAGYDAGTAQVFGELGYRIDAAHASFEPFANLSYVNLHSEAFNEEGGAAAFSGSSSTNNTTFTTLGVRASTAFTLGTVETTARGTVGWRHAYGDREPLSTLAFAGGDTFGVSGAPIAEDAVTLEAGLDFNLSPHATLGVSYTGQLANKMQDHGFKADIAVKF